MLDKQGTFVMSVHPGPIATDMIASVPEVLEIAESPQVVADNIIAALNSGDFHVFPDRIAREIKKTYQSFAEDTIEATILDK